MFIHSIISALFELLVILFVPTFGIGIFYGSYEMLGLTTGFGVIFGGTYQCQTSTKDVNDFYWFNLAGSVKELHFEPKIAVILLLLASIGLLAVCFLSFRKRMTKFSILAFIALIASLIVFIVAVEILNIGVGTDGAFKPNEPYVRIYISTHVQLIISSIVGILLVPLKDEDNPKSTKNKRKKIQKEYQNDYPFFG